MVAMTSWILWKNNSQSLWDVSDEFKTARDKRWVLRVRIALNDLYLSCHMITERLPASDWPYKAVRSRLTLLPSYNPLPLWFCKSWDCVMIIYLLFTCTLFLPIKLSPLLPMFAVLYASLPAVPLLRCTMLLCFSCKTTSINKSHLKN